MANVQFDDQGSISSAPYYARPQKGVVQWLLRKGVAKTEKEANLVLIITAVVCLAISIVVFLRSDNGVTPVSEEVIQDSLQSI